MKGINIVLPLILMGTGAGMFFNFLPFQTFEIVGDVWEGDCHYWYTATYPDSPREAWIKSLDYCKNIEPGPLPEKKVPFPTFKGTKGDVIFGRGAYSEKVRMYSGAVTPLREPTLYDTLVLRNVSLSSLPNDFVWAFIFSTRSDEFYSLFPTYQNPTDKTSFLGQKFIEDEFKGKCNSYSGARVYRWRTTSEEERGTFSGAWVGEPATLDSAHLGALLFCEIVPLISPTVTPTSTTTPPTITIPPTITPPIVTVPPILANVTSKVEQTTNIGWRKLFGGSLMLTGLGWLYVGRK